jgi:4-hydroxybenzoate polyprenyltransferase
MYAMVDKVDDLKIGVKSTAILFGNYDRQIIAILQITILILFIMVGKIQNLGIFYQSSLLIAAGLFIYQQILIVNRDKDACFKAFLNNNYFGLVIFIGLFLDYL